MTAKELQRIFQKGECLSLDTLRIYNEGKLNKKSMHEVEKHLLECGLCAGAVDGLNQKRLNEVNKLTEHIQRRLAVYMNTPPRLPFFRRFGAAIITSLILLIGSCSWWFFSDHKTTQVTNVSNSVQSNEIIQNGNIKSEQSNSQVIAQQTSSNTTDFSGGSSNPNAGKSKGTSSSMQDLPADVPGKQNILTVGQPGKDLVDAKVSGDKTDDVTDANSRTANSIKPFRVKSVLVYPPVTLNDKSTRKEAKDGQIGKSESSGGSFELDQMPTYPGGDDALKTYIMSNFKTGDIDHSQITRYATGVMFVVNAKTGAISAPELSFSISPQVDAELLRVINSMPNWNPGKKRGEVQIMLGITLE